MDNLDILLKEKAHNDVCDVPDILDRKIDNTLKSLPDKKRYQSISIRVSLIAATLTIIFATSALASSLPAVKNIANTVVSYFNNTKDTRYITDKSSFEKFNKAIGVSSDNNDIKLTVDNIAVDDNFINVFYTIQSKQPINVLPANDNKLFEAVLSTPRLHFKINGNDIKNGNNNDIDAYFESPNILKSMRRINVSQITLPENFDLEISTDEIFRTKGTWQIATNVNKSDVAGATKIVKPNIEANIDLGYSKHTITVDKVSISPFGSQLLISEQSKSNRMFNIFTLFDDKGNVLDVLNTDMQQNGVSLKSTNSFEFVKGTIDMKYITLVPIKLNEDGRKAIIDKQSIKELPITFKTCNTGSRVVDKIDFDKNIIRVSYHNEGVVLWDPSFQFFDALGNELNHSGVGSSISVDRQNGEFTQILEYANKNVDFSKITKIGTFTGVQNLELLEDQQIKINLDK